MKQQYFESAQALEKMHRLFLEVLKVELERLNLFDISNVQATILYNIGTGQLTVGELTNRGYYMGSNVSYNLRKMVQNGYVMQVPSLHDRRSSHVKLSPKGLDLYKNLDGIFDSHVDAFNKRDAEQDLGKLVKNLEKLQSLWQDLMGKGI